MGPMSYHYIFWDNDGVLVDTERYYLQASREALARIDITLDEEQFATISLAEGRSLFDLADERGVDGAITEELKRWRNTRYAQLLEVEDLSVAGAREALRQLHGKLRMAVVTSSQKHHFEIIHRRTGFLAYFEFCLTRESYQASKPSAEPYLMALQRCGCDPAQIVVIEDSPRGLKAAKAAGLTCWVLPGAHTQTDDFDAADRILDNILDVPRLAL